MKAPTKGKAKAKKNGKIVYTANEGARGQDIFRYVIRDRKGKGKRARGKVVVNLKDPNPVNPNPTFAELCAEPGVLLCDGFEDDLSGADFYDGSSLGPDPEVTTTISYEGEKALQLTVNGGNGADVSGSVGYDFGPVNSGTFYVSMRIRFGDGLQAKTRANPFNGTSGMKHFQIVDGPNSCTSNSINSSDAWQRGLWQMAYSCSGHPFFHAMSNGDFNLQPDGVDDENGQCTYRNLNGSGVPQNPACELLKDDVWHLHELEITIGAGVKWWVDGVLIVNQPHAYQAGTPQGPYDRIFLINYMTGYVGGSDPGLWRVWYDNLIVSRNCITSCEL